MAATEFNHKVWAALKLIPRGRVTTYKAIAKFIGKPKAARAVGNACNKNPSAPDTPCHRVIKSDGRLGGYAGGASQKIELLEKEEIKVLKGKVREFNNKIHRFRHKSRV